MTAKKIARKVVGAAALALLLATGVASAQTTTDTTVPNTGAGGNMVVNVITLGTSGMIALAGAAHLARRLKTQ